MIRHLLIAMSLVILCQCSHKPAIVNAPPAGPDSASRDGVLDQRVTCLNEKDTRSLEVQINPKGGCELFYTKYGMQKSIATAAEGNAYCREVSSKIKSNLIKSGFSCE